MSALDAQPFQDAVIHLFGEMRKTNDGTLSHNPSDPAHVKYFEQLAAVNGLSADRYPALYNRFRSAGAAPAMVAAAVGDANTGAFTDSQIVDYVAPLQSGLASAHGLITRTKPIANTFVALSVVNVNGATQTVVASGINQTFLQQTTEVQTNDALALALPTTGQNYGVMSYSVEYTDGTFDQNNGQSQWGYQTSADPTVQAPVINPNRHTGNLQNIMVGLSRGFSTPANNTDVDYWFWQTQYANNTLLVPFKGSMFFSKNIASLSASNPALYFYLARSEGGMSELRASNTLPYIPYFTINQQNPKQLDFTLLANPNDAGNAINFGVSPWVADTQTFFTARVVVTLTDLTLGWSSVLSSLNPDNSVTDGVTYIPPIIYVWHCLAAGTQVSMADGSTAAVETLNSGMAVKSPNGTTQNVMATLAQPHYGPVLVIGTQGGLSLTCSATHPMVTPSGAVQAQALVVGTTVSTLNGTDTVSSIQTQQQNGAGLFNLWLSGPQGQTMFYANGLLVGDYQLQVALLPANNPAQIAARLPAHLQDDYRNWVADRAARSR